MSFSNGDGGFAKKPRRAWPFAAALVTIAIVGGLYAQQKFRAPAETEPTPAGEKGGAPAAAVPGQPPAAPDSPVAPRPTLDLNEPAPDAAEQQAEAIIGQAKEIPARPVARLRGQGSWNDGLATLSEAIAAVRAAVAEAGLAVDGRPLVAFTDTDDNGFHFEALLPLAKAPDGKTKLGHGVEIAASPSGKALKFQHRGPYSDIDSTYEAITAFLDEKGLDTQNLFVEEYLTDPKTNEDDELEVDIYVFLK